MNIYRMLVEADELETFKNRTISSFNALFDEIDEYSLIEEDKDNILDSMKTNLISIINEFIRLGKTYEPDTPTDVPEKVFITNLIRYKNSSIQMLNDLSADVLEEFNTQTRYVLNLIEIHRVSFMKEGEVLYEE